MSINLFTTLLEKPMLDIIVTQLLQRYEATPQDLARLLLLLPNRRSCLECHRLFQQRSTSQTLLLPRIMPIGDMDDESIIALIGIEDAQLFDQLSAIHPVMPEIKRLMALGSELWQHQEQLELSDLEEKFNLDQMTRLASDILAFMDEMAQHEVPFKSIESLSPDSFAQHWQRSLAALKFSLRWWPNYSAAQKECSRVERINALQRLLAQQWQQHTPNYPIIAAGSTGSQPATARLLKLIMRMPHGQVIVPGLDMHADDAVWEKIAPTHPQYGLKELLVQCDVLRGDVRLLDDDSVQGARFERARLLLDSALPAELTHRWVAMHIDDISVQDFSVTECADEWEEARLIAALLREAVETPEHTAALVTHDHALARRVSAAMARYDIIIDSAMAQTMLEHPFAQFMMLLIMAAANRSASVPLLALLKHPYCQLLRDEVRQAQCVDALERELFRGIRQHSDTLDALNHASRRLKGDEAAFALQLFDALEPLFGAFNKKHTAADLVALHIGTLKQMCDASQHEESFDLLAGQLRAFASAGVIEAQLYPALLKRCLGLIRWIPKQDAHPRLHILSPMEARLIDVDRLILGGLNEGAWPHAPAESEWLNAPLRQAVGLPNVLAHIGQEAHDWVRLASGKQVFVTRAKRVGGADTLPSRWLERLCVMTLREMKDDLPDLAKAHLHWVRQKQQVECFSPTFAPAPCPPLSVRPKKLSVTQLDALLKDPYGYYASAILGLKSLDDLDEEASASTLGSLVHEVLERFVTAVNADASVLNEAYLLTLMDQVLAEFADRPQIVLVWSPRLKQIAGWIVKQEKSRRQQALGVMVEKKASAAFGGEIALTIQARMDRLEATQNNGLVVVDYKTGTAPKEPEIALGYGAQLPATALILKANDAASHIDALEYWKIGTGHKEPEIQHLKELDERLGFYAQGVAELITQYLVELRPYYAIPNPKFAPSHNRYAQLARIAEWYSDD